MDKKGNYASTNFKFQQHKFKLNYLKANLIQIKRHLDYRYTV